MSAAYAFVNYVRFKTQADVYTGTPYQNFSVNQTRTYSGVTYSFAPFAVSSGGGARGGDRSNAALVAGTDAISVNLFAEAVQNRYILEIKTVSLDPLTFADEALISTEVWRIASYEMDTTTITMRLTSPLDAVKAQIPRRTLSTELVGALPTSGALVVG
jgi:phage-related protein